MRILHGVGRTSAAPAKAGASTHQVGRPPGVRKLTCSLSFLQTVRVGRRGDVWRWRRGAGAPAVADAAASAPAPSPPAAGTRVRACRSPPDTPPPPPFPLAAPPPAAATTGGGRRTTLTRAAPPGLPLPHGFSSTSVSFRDAAPVLPLHWAPTAGCAELLEASPRCRRRCVGPGTKMGLFCASGRETDRLTRVRETAVATRWSASTRPCLTADETRFPRIIILPNYIACRKRKAMARLRFLCFCVLLAMICRAPCGPGHNRTASLGLKSGQVQMSTMVTFLNHIGLFYLDDSVTTF
jgi:hypothetical protein